MRALTLLTKKPLSFLFCLFFITTFWSCSKNPVTGKSELHFVSEQQELEMGGEAYVAMQQIEGGRLENVPELQSYIRSIGTRLAAVSDRPQLPFEFVILDNEVPNAWALPGGKIGVNRGLLIELENESELAAVLSHEIVHAAARHGAKAYERGLLMQSGLTSLGLLLNDSKHSQKAIGAGAMGMALLTFKYSRSAELEADAYGMEYMAKAGYHPLGAVTLQEKFLTFQSGKKQNKFLQLFQTHPPSQERLQKNKEKALALGPYGESNETIFQGKIAILKNNEKTFTSVEKGLRALESKQFHQAEKLASEALTLDPEYSKGHFLMGKVKKCLGNYSEAIFHFDRAITFNPNYFAYYLERGACHKELKNVSLMLEDYTTSLAYLDTPQARYELGLYALKQGNLQEANGHLLLASKSDSAEGKKAEHLLTRLDIPKNPEKYLDLSFALNQEGNLMIVCSNHSPAPIKKVGLAVWVTSVSGKVSSPYRFEINTPIKPRGREFIQTQIGPFQGIAQIENRVKGKILTAKVIPHDG